MLKKPLILLCQTFSQDSTLHVKVSNLALSPSLSLPLSLPLSLLSLSPSFSPSLFIFPSALPISPPLSFSLPSRELAPWQECMWMSDDSTWKLVLLPHKSWGSNSVL